MWWNSMSWQRMMVHGSGQDWTKIQRHHHTPNHHYIKYIVAVHKSEFYGILKMSFYLLLLLPVIETGR